MPIYTNEKVLKETISIEDKSFQKKQTNKSNFSEEKKNKDEDEIIVLQKKLEKAVEQENYELAAEIRDLINKNSKK